LVLGRPQTAVHERCQLFGFRAMAIWGVRQRRLAAFLVDLVDFAGGFSH
jgi:hypothetical protein